MENILSLIEMFCILMVYHVLFINKYNNLRKHILISFAISIVIMFIVSIKRLYFLNTTIATIFAIAITATIYKKNLFTNTVKIIVSIITVGIVEMILGVLIVLISIKTEISDSIYLISLCSSMSILIAFIYNKNRNKNWNFSEYIRGQNNIIMIIFNILLFGIAFKLFVQESSSRELMIIKISLVFITIIIVNAYYSIGIYKNYEKSKKNEIKESMNPLIGELINEMKASEHEYKNHLNILYCMIQVCKADDLRDKAKKYIGNVFEDSNLLNKLSEIENTIIKAILLSKINVAEKKDIDFQYKIDSELENISLDESELTVVLSNLLNNAIEACADIDNKKIYLETYYQQSKYHLKVSNSVANVDNEMIEKFKKAGMSTKGKGRGYGLYNISNIVRKHKGKLHIYLEENMFNVLIEI